MKSTLKMVLNLADKKTTTLSLESPKEGLTKAEVETCLNEIIAKQAILVNGAAPVEIKEIHIQNTEEKELA